MSTHFCFDMAFKRQLKHKKLKRLKAKGWKKANQAKNDKNITGQYLNISLILDNKIKKHKAMEGFKITMKIPFTI